MDACSTCVYPKQNVKLLQELQQVKKMLAISNSALEEATDTATEAIEKHRCCGSCAS